MRILSFPSNHMIASLLYLPPSRTPPFRRQFEASHNSRHFFAFSLLSQRRTCLELVSKSPRICLSSCLGSFGSSPSSTDDEFDVELGRLLALLPDEIRRRLNGHAELRHLIEVVMDLGRRPLARFPSGDFVLSDRPITVGDIEHATSQVGDFAIDNRAGISRTLHRISAIRNRKGAIIGLTCRVGRAISGSANLLKDLVNNGDSLLLIGPPGVGKTTIIREIARMLADDYNKRVMIVDTSNEIGGDGDIPHAGIGSARRMQVHNSDVQHKVLIEAVENHMPQVIVIDEIGTKLEAMAASTISQRGIQLVATAHGVTIENLIMNPSLDMLVGEIHSVTLGDEEASRRGVQKTVLERKGPSTFACGVEIISKSELRVHRSLEATVDAILSGRSPNFEVRKLISHEVGHEMQPIQKEPTLDVFYHEREEIMAEDHTEMKNGSVFHSQRPSEFTDRMVEQPFKDEMPLRLYVYGILDTSVIQGIKQLRMDGAVELTDNISEADALLALHAKIKKNPRIQSLAKSHDIPIYITKTSSLVQITKAIRSLMSEHLVGQKDLKSEDNTSSSEEIDALEEARLAMEHIVIPHGESVELLPRQSHIISLQMELIQKYQLQSEKVGKEPDLRLRILPFQTMKDDSRKTHGTLHTDSGSDDFSSTNGYMNHSVYSVDRLPMLPDSLPESSD